MNRHRGQKAVVSVEDALQDDEGTVTPEQLFDWCCLPERDFQTEDVRQKLEQAIYALPETLRPAFVLRELEGISTPECADVLGISIDVVKQRLHRSRLWLRERLSEYFAEWIWQWQKNERQYHQSLESGARTSCSTCHCISITNYQRSYVKTWNIIWRNARIVKWS